MTDFYTYMNAQGGKSQNEAPTMDEVTKWNKKHFVTVECADGGNTLPRLIKCIKDNGNVGHSFSIVVDPGGDKEKEKGRTFYWDGDGADKIFNIVSHDVETRDLNAILLSVMRDVEKILYISDDSSEGYSEEELRSIIKTARDTITTITSGVQYKNPLEGVVEEIGLKAAMGKDGDARGALEEIERMSDKAMKPNFKGH